MALRDRKRGAGIDATIIAVLLFVGVVVSVVEILWPLSLIVAASALTIYMARRFAQTAPPMLEARSNLTPDPTFTARRTEPGSVPLELSVERAAQFSAEPAVDPDKVWVRQGHSVKVGPYTIPGGMLYVGERLPALSGWRGDEPALINPHLPIDSARPDHGGTRMPYWPSYSGIPQESRAAYLEWLASGRMQSDVGIGYVFLFFYGLERRLLADAQQSSAARAEREQLLAEIDRLLGLYGDKGSFRGYAGSLLDAMRAQRSDRRLYEVPPPLERSGYELAHTARVALAQLAADKRPIPGEWAWTWLLCNPDASVRTAVRRCPEEFRALFLARYARKFGSGMTLKSAGTKLSLSYRPASASFGGTVDIPVGDLRDVAALCASPFSSSATRTLPVKRLSGPE